MCRYPCPVEIIYDNGSEFKLYFRELCDSYSIKRKPTTVKNPRANAVLERVHGILGNMMQTAGLDMSETVSDEMVDSFIDAVALVFALLIIQYLACCLMQLYLVGMYYLTYTL